MISFPVSIGIKMPRASMSRLLISRFPNRQKNELISFIASPRWIGLLNIASAYGSEIQVVTSLIV